MMWWPVFPKLERGHMVIIGAGADLSQDVIDVCIIGHDGKPVWKRFSNNYRGFADCLKWLRSFAETVQFVFEPTGRYGELFIEFMYKKGCVPLQADPFQVSTYAKSLDMRTVTDRKSAYALARYALERLDKCRKWRPKGDSAYELRDLQLLLRSLTKRLVTVKCQLKCGLRSQYVRAELEAERRRLEERIDEVLDRAEVIIRGDEQLAADLELLLEIPGIALKTAVMLLTLVDFRSFKNGRAVACFLGLTPRKHESGTSIKEKERMSKRGSTYIRSKLWMPARSTRRLDPIARDLSDRLLARDKHDWHIQVAAIRRLVTVAWAVVTKGVPYDPNYRHPLSKPI